MTEQLAQLRRYLNEIPELYEEAAHYLEPGSAPIDPLGKRGATIFRIPISPEIFDLLDLRDKALDDVMLNRSAGSELIWEDSAGRKVVEPVSRRLGVLPTLGLWVSLVWAELDDLGQEPRECCPARSHSVAGEAGWLCEYVQPILELHPDFFRDIELLHAELRKACRVRREYVPTCPVCATATKRNRIEAVYGEDGTPAWWRCTSCPKTWVHDAEVQRLARTQPKMTLRQIAIWLNIPYSTLQRWRKDKRFITDSRGLAEVDHVLRVADKMRPNLAIPA